MSDIQLSQNDKQEQLQANLWRMRWFFIRCIFLWSALWMIIIVVVLCVTKSLISLSLLASLAAPFLVPRRLIKFLFPMDEHDCRIRELEIQAEIEKAKFGNAKSKSKAVARIVKTPLQLFHTLDPSE